MAWQDDPIVQPADEPWRNDPVIEPTSTATQQRDYASEVPSGAELTDIGVQGEKALPVFVRHALDRAQHVVPQSWGELGEMAGSLFPPLEAYRQTKQGYQIATGTPPQEAVPGITQLKDLEDIKNQYGGGSPEYQAAAGDVAGDILPQMIMAALTAKSLKVPEPSHLRTEPLAPKPPPTVSIGPGTIAGDVSRALERRFTLQDEPPPDIAPASSLEETLTQTRRAEELDTAKALAQRINQLADPDIVRAFAQRAQPVPPAEPEIPLRPVGPLSETAVEKAMRTTAPDKLQTATEIAAGEGMPPVVRQEIPGVTYPPLRGPEQPAGPSPQRTLPSETAQIPPPPIGTPLKPVPLHGEPGTTAADVAAKVPPVAQPQPVPVAPEAPGGVPVAGTQESITAAAVRYEDGRVETGPTHALITGGHGVVPGSADGFVTSTGRFVDAKEAHSIATNARQAAPNRSGIIIAEDIPELAEQAAEPYTPEAAAQRAAQQPSGAGLPPEETGISKAAIAGQREARELPAIERQKQIDFGESLDRAKATLAQDPMAGQRLVEELHAKPRSVTPEDTPLLIERMQQAQLEFDAANRAVNEAVTGADRTVAKARLEHARTEYDKTVTATQNATSSTGAGLNSVKMILNEDYSLARMESRKRAANNGSISPGQKLHTDALHAKITEASNGLDMLEQLRREGKEAVAARKAGKRITDYTGEAAKKARERIQRQLHGLGAKPAPPTLLYDYAVVGADHLARGLTKFSDWSAQMIREFGEKVKPHLQDLWKMARAVHDKTAKAFRTPEEVRLERYKTGLAKQTVGVTAKIQRGDFTKPTRQQLVLDKAAYKMKGNLQRLKNEFERGVAKDAYNNMSPGDKFWQHFVGVERGMKLSSPAVFQKLGLAAAVREVLAPIEAGGGYAAATFFPRLAKGTRYGADLRTITRAEIKAKVAFFTEGMKDAAENLKGKETTLEAMSDKYGRQPNFWYNRIGKIHAAVKAPVKRAEFVRSLEHRMDAAVKAGEDINHPEVMDRLATESALDANRAIFQQNTVVSKFFSMLDKAHPAAGRTARFLFPITKIPVNLFKELVTYNLGAPAAVARIGHAYWKGVETLPPAARESIIRQLTKGSVGGAAILWGYWNSEKVHDFFASMPTFFQHTPIAMAIHEGSLIKRLEEQGSGTYYKPSEAQKEAAFAAKSSIPFMYTLTDAMDAITKPGGAKKWFYNMIHSTVVPQAVSWTAKELDKPTPFSIFDKTTYRPPRDIVEAVTQGIPGLREDIPEYQRKGRSH